IRSVVAMAGNINLDDPLVSDANIPVMHIMDDHDEFDSYSASIQWDHAHLPTPRWIVTLRNATHVPPYTRAGDAHFELVSAITIEFFDGTLKAHPERLEQVTTDLNARGDLAALER